MIGNAGLVIQQPTILQPGRLEDGERTLVRGFKINLFTSSTPAPPPSLTLSMVWILQSIFFQMYVLLVKGMLNQVFGRLKFVDQVHLGVLIQTDPMRVLKSYFRSLEWRWGLWGSAEAHFGLLCRGSHHSLDKALSLPRLMLQMWALAVRVQWCHYSAFFLSVHLREYLNTVYTVCLTAKYGSSRGLWKYFEHVCSTILSIHTLYEYNFWVWILLPRHHCSSNKLWFSWHLLSLGQVLNAGEGSDESYPGLPSKNFYSRKGGRAFA